MKLLYEIASGNVVARYSDQPLDERMGGLSFEPKASEGYALIVVPNSVAIPEAIIRVVEGDVPSFIVDQAAVDQQWASIKQARNHQLSQSDWICSVTDYVHPKKQEWIAHRQALRDLSQQANPFSLAWPASPM